MSARDGFEASIFKAKARLFEARATICFCPELSYYPTYRPTCLLILLPNWLDCGAQYLYIKNIGNIK